MEAFVVLAGTSLFLAGMGVFRRSASTSVDPEPREETQKQSWVFDVENPPEEPQIESVSRSEH